MGAVGVIIAATAVLALAGAVAYWLFGVVVNGTASICTSRHFVAWSGAPDFEPHWISDWRHEPGSGRRCVPDPQRQHHRDSLTSLDAEWLALGL